MSEKTKETEQIKLVLTPSQADVISKALEAYSRASMGQFTYALKEMFPTLLIDLRTGDLLDMSIRYMLNVCAREKNKSNMFPEEAHSSWGILQSDKCGDGTMAWHISKAIKQWRAVTNNAGMFGHGRDFDGCGLLWRSDEPQPYIEGFVTYKDYPLFISSEGEDFVAFNKAYKSKKWPAVWDRVHSISKTYNFPRGDKSEIRPVTTGRKCVNYILRIHKPRKDDIT